MTLSSCEIEDSSHDVELEGRSKGSERKGVAGLKTSDGRWSMLGDRISGGGTALVDILPFRLRRRGLIPDLSADFSNSDAFRAAWRRVLEYPLWFRAVKDLLQFLSLRNSCDASPHSKSKFLAAEYFRHSKSKIRKNSRRWILPHLKFKIRGAEYW